MEILLPSQSCAVFEWVLCSPPIELPFHVALLQVLQTGKQSAMLLIILCYIYYVHLHTIYSVNDYKSLNFLSKIVTSIISDTMVLLMDENIVLFIKT